MTEKHKIGKDGLLNDGVSTYPADAHDMQLFADAREAMSRFSTPVLIHSNNPSERLFVAAFDGTGNDVIHDPEHATNVAKINQQIERLNEAGDGRIGVGYVAGPGTQSNALDRAWDGIRGHTYDERLEEMYKLLTEKAYKWKQENPDVQIHIADIGFSRGAEQAAGFSRLVHERGIQDPSGASYTYNSQGQITGVAYNKLPLVPPGQVAQVLGLFDPVGTGEPVNDKDRRPPPSVISGVGLIAEDERRGLFRSSHIIDPGLSSDGRFLGLMVPGAHSDVGGSYHRDGLGIRSGNLMVDYLNALSDKPFLEKQPEPDDPRRNVVHRSEEGMLLYRIWDKVDRRQPEGYEERLVPRSQVGKAPDAYNAEPRDETLNRQFERQHVRSGAMPESTPVRQQEDPATPAPQTITPPIPEHLKDFRHPDHPQHGRYQSVLHQVHRMEETHGITPGPHSERMAAAWVERIGQEKGFDLDRFEMRGADVVALPRRDNYFETQRELSLNADRALARPVEQVSADWGRRVMPHLGQPQSVPESAMAGQDLRHPDPARQRQFDTLREQVADIYAKAGILRNDAQLERAAWAVALDMQRHGLDRADRLYLLSNLDGTIGPDSGIGTTQGQYPLQLRGQIPPETLQQTPDESHRQLAQVTQQQAFEQQQRQAAAQQQAPVLG